MKINFLYAIVLSIFSNCGMLFADTPKTTTPTPIIDKSLIHSTSYYTLIYYPDKKKRSQLFRIGHEKTSLVTWLENGQKASEITYRNNLMYRKLTWYPTGQQQSETYYHIGKPLKNIYMALDGHKVTETEYLADGQVHTTFYTPTGQKMRDQFLAHGHLSGISTAWYPTGNIMSQTTYEDAHHYHVTYYAETKKKTEERHYLDNKKEGPDIFFKEDGTILNTIIYKNGIKQAAPPPIKK